MITQNALKYFVRYNPETGVFRHNRSVGRSPAHSVAGCVQPNGYRRIKVAGKDYLASRLAFLYMTGRWPDPQVDHINRARDDNRWSNLREVTASENNRNRAPSGAVPHVGVSMQGKKFRAQICVNGRSKHLGTFETAEQAAAAYSEAAKNL